MGGFVMSKGSEKPEHEFDKECPYCNKWYRKRGWKSHVRDCPAQGKDDVHPWIDNSEKKEETTMTETNESDKTDSFEGIICPECANRDDGNGQPIYNANTNMKSMLNKRGVLTDHRELLIDQYDYYCAECSTLFNEEEI